MKALVYRSPRNKKLEDMPKPTLREETNIAVRSGRFTTCGTELLERKYG